MGLRVLVTGANGFIGKAFCNQAVLQGFKVRGSFRKNILPPLNVEPFYVSESLSEVDWIRALNGVDVVLHLAARVHEISGKISDLNSYREINVNGTLNLARQAATAGVGRFVFVSSIGVNGSQTQLGQPFSEADQPKPIGTYALSKLEAELGLMRLTDGTGLQVTIIRPPLVYGAGALGNFALLKRVVQRGWPLPLGGIHNKRSLVGLNNFVDFILTCISHPQAANQTFLVCDGQDLSTPDLLRGMMHVAGLPDRLLPVPFWVLKAGFTALGKGHFLQKLSANLQVDMSKACNLLGWVPPFAFEEELRRAML
jgi:nucleoside-diphosphate-sugar epimerase